MNPKAAIQQSSFVGGEWGPYAWGLSDDPHYSTAMTVCLNGYPTEEGAWLKRSGTQFLFPTYGGNYANILPFDGSETCSFAMEFTSPPGAANGNLRFITQSSLIMTNDAQTVVSVSGGSITLSGNPSWSVGDQVFFVFPDTVAQADQLTARSQMCNITTWTAGTNAVFSVNGYFTGGIVTTASTNLVGATVLHVANFATPYTGGVSQLQSLRAVQAEIDSIILCPDVPPQEVQVTTVGTSDTDPLFTFQPLILVDGPYLNPQSMSLSLSALSGTITLTAGSAAFALTDVGRHVRIFTQPPIYNPASTYTVGETVTDSTGAWWTALTSVAAGQAPGQVAYVNGVATVVWGPNPTAGSWAWGKITAYTNSTHVTFAFDTSIPDMVLQSGNGDTAYEWQLGVFSGTTGYPTCGIYYEGRLWFAGCVPNRFDTTISNGVTAIIGDNTATFSPTDPYGNVLDSSGISEVLNSVGINQIQWMIGDQQGVVMGTLSGETLVAASSLGDPITPTSIQAHEVTRLGSENIEAVRAGMAIIFAQKYGRRVMEYLDDAFSSKWSGRHLNKYSKHISASGVQRLAYQEEPIPTVWALMNNGVLAGCTYRRFTRFVQSDPEAAGWHRHMHGRGRPFTSMCSVPGKSGLLDRLFVVTNDPPNPTLPNNPAPTNYFVEILQTPFDPASDTQLTAWMLDESGGPGPGNSGFDCGGGNASAVFPSGFYQGADSTTPAAPAGLTTFQNITLGESPPAGGVLLLNKSAAFFPGSVLLYGLPKFGLPTDETKMSASFWIGTTDLPLNSGALISSPEITYSESGEGGGSQITSSIFGGCADGGFSGDGIAYTGSNNALAASCVNNPQYPYEGVYQQAEIAGTGNSNWIHVMVSVKSNGNGTVTTLVVCNDTTVVNNVTSAADVGASGDMWPFNSQQDEQKDNGLALWSIGGAFVQSPNYTLNIQQSSSKETIIVGESALEQLKDAHFKTTIYGVPVTYNGQGVLYTLQGSQYSVTINNVVDTVTGDGGPSNMPVPTSLGQATGYIGNVAELWVIPGTFIDWTSSTNRYKFHEYDSITEAWGPIPLGTTGTKPGLGTPWLYLSGGPSTFPLNNATGNWLVEFDTTSGIINIQTGEGGGLQESQLPYLT